MSYSSPPPYSQTQPGYQQPPPQHFHAQYAAPPSAPTIIIQTSAAPRVVPVANEPTQLTCPACQAVVRTTVVRQPSMRTHLCALLLCFFVLSTHTNRVQYARTIDGNRIVDAFSEQIFAPPSHRLHRLSLPPTVNQANRNMSYNKPPPYAENAPQPGFTPASYYQPPPQQSTVIIHTTAPTTLVPISGEPTRITCPSCHADVLTTVKYQPNSCTHIWALVLCLFICWPCVCVPYCMDSCQNANHYCPSCNAYIGTYQN